jgi:GAF domain-containing protein
LTDDGVLPLAACELLCRGLPRAASMDAALGLLEKARAIALGEGMLTVNRDVTTAQDPAGEIRLRRIWSSRPDAYPVGGGKTKTQTPWSRQLLQRGEVFVGEGDAALAQVFDDHARIASLGLHCVVNVPLLSGGRCAATFNVLGTRAQWQAREIAAIELLALLATPHVLRP